MSDGTILTPDVLRQHADKAMSPHWEGEARQLLKWAADLIYAAELLRLDMNLVTSTDAAQLPQFGTTQMITIAVKISAGAKMCGDCEYKTIFHTGLVDEFHPKCEIFRPHYGDWGARDMKRSRRCLKAERTYAAHLPSTKEIK